MGNYRIKGKIKLDGYIGYVEREFDYNWHEDIHEKIAEIVKEIGDEAFLTVDNLK